jgi:cytochrome c
VGGVGTLGNDPPGRTVGSIFPYATTAWEYIRRAMPRLAEGTLSTDEVYAVTAWLLYRNGIVGEDATLTAESLPKVQMPNRDGFVPKVPTWKPGDRRPYGYYP